MDSSLRLGEGGRGESERGIQAARWVDLAGDTSVHFHGIGLEQARDQAGDYEND
jgi:hypothetical protein